MATLIGVLKFRGSVGNLTICKYKSKKGLVVRKKKDKMDKKYYKNSPTMAPVRRNNNEFSVAKKTAILINNAFRMNFQDFERGHLYQRLSGLFKVVMSKDLKSEHGKRTIREGLLHPEGRELLEGFDFTPKSRTSDFYTGAIQVHSELPAISLKDLTSIGSGMTKASHIEFKALQLNLDLNSLKFTRSMSDPVLVEKKDIINEEVMLTYQDIDGLRHLSLVFLCCRSVKKEAGTYYPLNGGQNFNIQLVAFTVF
ncbi:hypothetical protein [Zhouia amylolytica]|uniref:hypothetical protein n=1 Tax=Zhouia amylolytica TaxID=376730 RepID=UPI0020CE1DF7|nr:hypothetical protein [Zhouia amylolytica]MCQ0111209.1 hypothetical protein [Zhouia amylolytica]